MRLAHVCAFLACRARLGLGSRGPDLRRTMSVRSELEELVKWISDLQKEEKPVVEPQPLPREDWTSIENSLKSASSRFARAAEVLAAEALGDQDDHRSILAEFALDLNHEAGGLALRADLLSARAKPRTAAEKAKLEAEKAALDPEKAKLEAEEKAERERERQAAETHEGETGGEGEDTQSPVSVAEHVRYAELSINHAHNKLKAAAHPDPVTNAFQGDLDVLAEMTLTLRQECLDLPAAPAVLPRQASPEQQVVTTDG
jgi:hypothetical protein